MTDVRITLAPVGAPPSPRALLADRLAAIICDKRMTAPFGGDVTKGKRSYDILFAKPRTLDGLVQVFSPKFILIQASASGRWPYQNGQCLFNVGRSKNARR